MKILKVKHRSAYKVLPSFDAQENFKITIRLRIFFTFAFENYLSDFLWQN